MKKTLLSILFLSALSGMLRAQSLTDGLMMPKKYLCTGVVFTKDKWRDYWEGELKRHNDNIGELTTKSVMWVGNYGITDRINVIAMLPYVETEASGGTLKGQKGIQDLTVGMKYNFYRLKSEKYSFKTFGVMSVSTPMTDYTPDFFPLSLGTSTTNVGFRLIGNFKIEKGFYINASGAYTWRSNTELDRPSYYEGTSFHMSSEVKMPNVFDWMTSIGYLKGPLRAELNFMKQNTLGGGDIRRQDMPFVSNRMNYGKGGVLLMYYLPKPAGLAVHAEAAYTFSGRNVGQSTMYNAGLLYTIKFAKPNTTQE
jgi:hypothetical protein